MTSQKQTLKNYIKRVKSPVDCMTIDCDECPLCNENQQCLYNELHDAIRDWENNKTK